MEERKKLVSEISLVLDKIERRNTYRIKSGDLKEVFNYLLRVEEFIENSNLPEEEKNLYKSIINPVLKPYRRNIQKINEQTARKGLKDVCFCLREILERLKEKSYRKIRSTSK
ncbi:MAG: hypothetical protein QW609_03075 [Candidatus Aenigmatarchaeota archaeon]